MTIENVQLIAESIGAFVALFLMSPLSTLCVYSLARMIIKDIRFTRRVLRLRKFKLRKQRMSIS